MKIKTIILTVLALVLSSFVLFINQTKAYEPKEVYRVYLEGKTIGFINSKEKLEEYIDKEQQELKDKYNISKIYTPNSLDIIKEVSFNEEVSTEKEIYEKIKDIAPFTIKGYTFDIKGLEIISDTEKVKQPDVKIHVLDKEMFNRATLKAMNSFITAKDYESFINNTQEEIKDVGSYIQDIYIKNKGVVRETYIPADEKIYTDEEELVRYILFGTLETKKRYTVKENDTIVDIAYNHQLSNDEFLTVNHDLTSIDNLLYTGQVVDVTLINPLFQFVQQNYVVQNQVKKFNTKTEEDNTMAYGTEKEKQKGINGLDRITKIEVVVNGKLEKADIESKTEISPVVDRIIVKGTKRETTVHIPDDGPIGSVGTWHWPTNQPYVITSPFGWRWGKLHAGVDISGTGYGSPIFAANSGVVVDSGYHWMNGNYVTIDHRNGYTSMYAHMSEYPLVRIGDNVTMGNQIGKMGASGYASGVHLHFSIYKGPIYGGTPLNPVSFYQ